MRFFKMVPVFALAVAIAATACSQEGAEEEGTELTPADTAMTTPPPAEPDVMMDDTMMMGDTAAMMADTMAM